jgi:hypothetical protein
VEPAVVEVDDRVEVGGEAVVEVRKGRFKTQELSKHCNSSSASLRSDPAEVRSVPLNPANSGKGVAKPPSVGAAHAMRSDHQPSGSSTSCT